MINISVLGYQRPFIINPQHSWCFQINIIHLGTEEEEDLDAYIPEDHEVKKQHTHKTVQRVQAAIMQDLQQALGVGESFPEDAMKELILQVTIFDRT